MGKVTRKCVFFLRKMSFFAKPPDASLHKTLTINLFQKPFLVTKKMSDGEKRIETCAMLRILAAKLAQKVTDYCAGTEGVVAFSVMMMTLSSLAVVQAKR